MLAPDDHAGPGRALHVRQAVRQGRGETGGGSVRPSGPRRKNGTYTLRALGDMRVLALVEAADAGDWEAVKEALAPFDLAATTRILGELADLDGVEDWIGRRRRGGQGAPGDGPADIRDAAHQLGLGGPHQRTRRGRHAGAVADLPRAAATSPRSSCSRPPSCGRSGSPRGAASSPPAVACRWARRQRDPAATPPCAATRWTCRATRVGSQLQPRWGGEPGAGPGVRPRGVRRRARRSPSRLRDRHGPHRGLGGVGRPDCLDTPGSRPSWQRPPTAASCTPTTSGTWAGSTTSTCSPWPCSLAGEQHTSVRRVFHEAGRRLHRAALDLLRGAREAVRPPPSRRALSARRPRPPRLPSPPDCPMTLHDAAAEPGRRRPHLPGRPARPGRPALPPPLLQPPRLPARAAAERRGRLTARRADEPAAPARRHPPVRRRRRAARRGRRRRPHRGRRAHLPRHHRPQLQARARRHRRTATRATSSASSASACSPASWSPTRSAWSAAPPAPRTRPPWSGRRRDDGSLHRPHPAATTPAPSRAPPCT